ncbi:MAG: hypothetical protein Q4A44_06245 [Bacteroidales bacterium]|nr:hypothetical protein [Bacteroidales bacterium]
MKVSEQTQEQVVRLLRKVAARFDSREQAEVTDILLQVKPESGELLAFDDKGDELHRCVIEDWINTTSEGFLSDVQAMLTSIIECNRTLVEAFNILRPFSLVLADESGETLAELYLVDDDLMIINSNLMEGLSDDLDAFLEQLLAK